MTNSSSGSSLGDLLADSPTHVPTHPPAHPRPIIDFTKSLPVGSSRPLFREPVSGGPSMGALSTGSSFATPRNYRAEKPHPAAFMSTGLISKRNRNPDDRQMTRAGSKAQMPDTPCKRPSSIFAAPPAHMPEVPAKSRQAHHEFGTPSMPFNPHTTGLAPGTFGKRASVFGVALRLRQRPLTPILRDRYQGRLEKGQASLEVALRRVEHPGVVVS